MESMPRKKIKEKLGSENTFGAVAQISAHIDQNQTVKHIGKLATFFVGSYEEQKNTILKDFCEQVQKHNLSILYKKKILKKKYGKNLFFYQLTAE